MYAFVTLPTPTNLLNDIGAWSSPFFDAWLPIAVFIIGVLLAALVIRALISWIIGGFSALTHKKEE